MVLIQNNEAISLIRKAARISNVETAPTKLADSVIPVIDMTPDFHSPVKILKTAAQSTTGTFVVFTPLANKRTFLTGVYISFIKDATADTGSGSLDVGVVYNNDGTTKFIISLPVLTLTAQSESVFISFGSKPIEITAKDLSAYNSSFTGTYTVGLMSRSATFYGYEENIY